MTGMIVSVMLGVVIYWVAAEIYDRMKKQEEKMDWTVAIGLGVIHLALCGALVAMVWYGPLSKQVKREDVKKDK